MRIRREGTKRKEQLKLMNQNMKRINNRKGKKKKIKENHGRILKIRNGKKKEKIRKVEVKRQNRKEKLK